MPRQNFLSKESFVAATEQQAKETILSIPAFANNIRLIAENKMIESFRFAYEEPVKKMMYYIDVTVRTLNDQYARISMHGTYASGEAFKNGNEMAIALHDFESAVMAALKGDVSLYQPRPSKPAASKGFLVAATTLAATAGFLFLKKKLS
jgi:hypothetical protein